MKSERWSVYRTKIDLIFQAKQQVFLMNEWSYLFSSTTWIARVRVYMTHFKETGIFWYFCEHITINSLTSAIFGALQNFHILEKNRFIYYHRSPRIRHKNTSKTIPLCFWPKKVSPLKGSRNTFHSIVWKLFEISEYWTHSYVFSRK